MIAKQYKFSAAIWIYPGKAAWHFVSVPSDITADIDFYFSAVKRGWGSLPVKVRIGQTTWDTSIFPDKKTRTYLLPIKSDVRKKEKIEAKDTVDLIIDISG